MNEGFELLQRGIHCNPNGSKEMHCNLFQFGVFFGSAEQNNVIFHEGFHVLGFGHIYCLGLFSDLFEFFCGHNFCVIWAFLA